MFEYEEKISLYYAKFEVKTRLDLGVFLVRSSFKLVSSSIQLGHSGTSPCLPVALQKAVLLAEGVKWVNTELLSNWPKRHSILAW